MGLYSGFHGYPLNLLFLQSYLLKGLSYVAEHNPFKHHMPWDFDLLTGHGPSAGYRDNRRSVADWERKHSH